MTPYVQAAAALAVIDRHCQDGANHSPDINDTVEQAYRDLAACLDAIYGPLPPRRMDGTYSNQSRRDT